MTHMSADRPETDYESLYRRYVAQRRQVDHLSALREIGLAVNSSLELSEALPSIANVVQGALEIRRLTIYELDKDGDLARPMVARYDKDLISRERLVEDSRHIPGTPLEQAIQTRRVVLNETPYQHQAYVPLVAKNEVLGIMLLEDRQDGAPFDEHDADLFQQIGLQIAIAINNAQLYAMAVIDGLTGLYVRRYFDLRMQEMFEEARRYGTAFSLLLFDIDHFKKFNDTYGHQTGDLVLKQFAQLLKENARKADVCCRYGGEEMAIVLPETKLDQAAMQGNRLCRKVRNNVFLGIDGTELHVTTSIGVATHSENYGDPAAMVKAADKALYEAKELGRNRVEVAEP